jgi:RNA polymerase sigma-70 factor (ECF subfamily)
LAPKLIPFSYLPTINNIDPKIFTFGGNFCASIASFNKDEVIELNKDNITFTIFYNKFKRKLFNYVLKMTGNKMVTEDIIQNLFLKFFENISLIRNEESIPFWLFKTARNEVFIYFRSVKREFQSIDFDDTEEFDIESDDRIDEIYEVKEVSLLLQKELDLLHPVQKEIFILKEYGNLSYKEIAELLNIDENLVKSRLFKTRRKLISKLSKLLK